ncbi:hypothetical protein AB4Z48_18215 [Cupriavidus sp. 2TAF22]|uniref:hypothetical protein n=1 Tax=unclassified Cupriavidus TaxID=2640874 RepID=UPI003F90A27A
MTTQTIEVQGFILGQKNSWSDKIDYTWSTVEMIEHGYMTIGRHTLTFDLPDGFDVITEQIRMLERQRDKIRAQLAKRIKEINEQIQSLQAIEYTPAESVASPL